MRIVAFDFVKKLCPEAPVYITSEQDTSLAHVTFHRGKAPLIFVTQALLNEPDHVVKAALLHEIGHLDSNKYRSKAMKELHAHTWAIDKAFELKLHRSRAWLLRGLKQWQFLDKRCRYYKAYKLFTKEQASC